MVEGRTSENKNDYKKKRKIVENKLEDKKGMRRWSDSSSTETDNEEHDEETDRADEMKMVEGGRSEKKKHYEGKKIIDENKLKRKEDTRKRVDLRKDGQRVPEVEKADFHSFSEFDDGSEGVYVHKDVKGRKKNLTIGTARGNAYKNLDHLKILGDSLSGKGEGLETYVEKKIGEEDSEVESVEISEIDKEVEMCWAEANMYLYPDDNNEEIDSTQPKYDNDDHSNSETGQATLCSQGNHPHLYLDEQVGIVCKCCSIVVEEIRHILPEFSKHSSSSRKRDTFVRSETSRMDDYL